MFQQDQTIIKNQVLTWSRDLTPMSSTPESYSVPEHISRRIRSIRYIGILGVVLSHAIQNPIFFLQGEVITSPTQLQALISNPYVAFLHSMGIYGLFYGAVPMFFLASAYLQFSKPRDYKSTVLRRVRSLVLPFVLWTAISIALMFLLKATIGITYNPALLESCDWHLWLQALFGNYSQAWIRGTHCPVIMFQFWFIRDLFILTLFTPLFGFLMREKRRGIGFLIVSGLVLAAGCRPVIVGGDSLFYYALGAFFACHKIDFMTLLDRFWHWGFEIALAIGSVAWMYAQFDGNPDPDTPMWVQLSSALFLLKFSNIIASSQRLYKISCQLDGLSFFLYCAHAPIVGTLCAYVMFGALHDHISSILIVFGILAMGFINAAFCTGLGALLKRFCPRVFSFLTGGRTTKR